MDNIHFVWTRKSGIVDDINWFIADQKAGSYTNKILSLYKVVACIRYSHSRLVFLLPISYAECNTGLAMP
jgi:hypothetical protein